MFSAILFIASSCKKEEKTFSQEDLNGTWQSEELSSLGCTQQLEISSTNLNEIKICDGVRMRLEAENYSFDGQIIKYKLYGLNMEFEIVELTEHTLVLGPHDPEIFTRVGY